MKFYFLTLTAWLYLLASSAQTEGDFPELYFGKYKDRALVDLSFRLEVPGYLKLVERDGDSSQNFTIVSGIIELLATGEREQIKSGGYLSDEAKFMISQAMPGIIKISVFCRSNDMTSSFEITYLMALGVNPVIVMENVFNGDSTVAQSTLEKVTAIKVGYPNYPDMEDFFKISGGTITLEAETENGKILPNGILDERALLFLRTAAGRKVKFIVVWEDSSGAGWLYVFEFLVTAN